MPPRSSDRGKEIAESLRSGNKQHLSDVVGAKGCYYCWLGDYAKCEANCQKVHKVAGVAGSSTDVDAFDHATPFLTRMFQQTTSVFDETRQARSIAASTAKQLHQLQALERDVREINVPCETTHQRGASATSGGQRNSALYDKRSSASIRNPSLKTLHEPQFATTAYKYPRGAVLIQVTPHTLVSVAPSTHTYGAHHRAELESGDAMWTGRLVKEGRVANDSRSVAIAERIRNGKSLTPTPSRSPSHHVSTKATDARSNHADTTPQSFRRPPKYSVEEDSVASHIMSGVYHSAIDLPLPTVFDPIVYQ